MEVDRSEKLFDERNFSANGLFLTFITIKKRSINSCLRRFLSMDLHLCLGFTGEETMEEGNLLFYAYRSSLEQILQNIRTLQEFSIYLMASLIDDCCRLRFQYQFVRGETRACLIATRM